MTIIVENGTGVANANSYIDGTYLTDYAALRGVDIAAADVEPLLIRAMDYIESKEFQGCKVTSDQPLQFPRYNVWVDGYYVEQTTIPEELKRSQAETALAIDQGNDPLQDMEPGVKSDKVGPITVEYQDNGITRTINARISTTLRKLLCNTGFGINKV